MSTPSQKGDEAKPSRAAQESETVRVPEDAGFVPVAPTEQPGARLGRYKLLHQIGEGGCGVVHMAEQLEPVRRLVALKVIKLGMDTKQVTARFDAERQALALMDHPNIAKVLDAGATDTGRPYFVMELVQGIRITDYCDQKNLSTHARLDLFIRVCQAVQHAHQKGIIHRDIKPSNILVASHDGVPVPKVIDFGIAKATEGRLTDLTIDTELHQFIGTPAYMSPEQAEMTGLDLDTRTDIYALGVLLYQLLTGRTPFDPKKLLESGLDEIRRTIREVEPTKPSTRLGMMFEEERTTVARHRQTQSARLSHLLRGDLDWIVMKCLEKDRARRYETASGLAMDIQRHLDDEPVTAGAPSRLYRFRKFVRRNQGPVAASAAVLVVLIAGVVGTTIGLLGQARQRAEAEKQAKAATRQAAVAEAVGQFQSDMLAAADPNKLLGDKVTVLQAVTAAVRQLDAGKLNEQPLVEASVRATIGKTLDALGRHYDAEPNLRKALQLRRKVLPSENADIATSLFDLAWTLRNQSKFGEAEPLLREALDIFRRTRPEGHRDIPTTLTLLGTVLDREGKQAEAERFSREALDLQRKYQPAGEISRGLNNLAALLDGQGKIAPAEQMYREALEIRRKTAAGHPILANTLVNLAKLLKDQGRLDEAEALYLEALDINRKVYPAGHPNVARSLDHVASLLQAQGKYAQAEPISREALEIRRKTLAPDHLDIATSLYNLARLLDDRGKLAEAELLAREALDIRRQGLPADHVTVAASLSALALVLGDQRKFAEAEPLHRQALDIRRKAMPAGHTTIAACLNNLAVLLRDEGKLAEAEALAREALEMNRKALSPGHAAIAGNLTALAAVLGDQGKPAEAELLLREALEIRRKALPAGHPETARTSDDLADILLLQGNPAESASLYLEAIASYERTFGKDHANVGAARAGLGLGMLQLHRHREAENSLLEAERILASAHGIRAGRHDKCVEALIELYAAWDKTEPGKGYAARAEQWKAARAAPRPETSK